MSDWASSFVEALARGETVRFRPTGNSMRPRIESGQLVVVVPAAETAEVGDVVLCRVRGKTLLHLVKAIDGDRFLIANNKGRPNGWTHRRSVYGRVTAVLP